jgi:hypothetical protein
MSRRLLRRTFSRLLLAAPVLPLTSCLIEPVSSCGPAGGGGPGQGDQTYRIADLYLADGGTPSSSTSCQELCALTNASVENGPCSVNVDGGQPDSVTCRVYYFCEGRRPEGLVSDGSVPGRVSELGAMFARMAHLEAASVPAFERLAEELAALGAPAHLVRAARRAAAEEVRHAQAMGALALRHGAPLPPVVVEPPRPRSLAALARENAVEGCVRETFGALLAGWQARTAQDAEVRQALARIAPEELRHAELSWALDAWAQRQLSAAEREQLLAARDEALRTLTREVEESTPGEEAVRLAGLPSREDARALVHGLAELVRGMDGHVARA